MTTARINTKIHQLFPSQPLSRWIYRSSTLVPLTYSLKAKRPRFLRQSNKLLISLLHCAKTPRTPTNIRRFPNTMKAKKEIKSKFFSLTTRKNFFPPTFANCLRVRVCSPAWKWKVLFEGRGRNFTSIDFHTTLSERSFTFSKANRAPLRIELKNDLASGADC